MSLFICVLFEINRHPVRIETINAPDESAAVTLARAMARGCFYGFELWHAGRKLASCFAQVPLIYDEAFTGEAVPPGRTRPIHRPRTARGGRSLPSYAI